MNTKIPCLLAAMVCGIALHPSCARAQGSLTPPGAPAPTMKTLAQIEARIPVDAVNTLGTSAAQYAITHPGSYYLTGNITGVGGVPFGILIEASDVTLDLNGFAMTGLGNGYDGIVVSVAGSYQNIVIRNGTLRNWGDGVAAPNGHCELQQLRVYGDVLHGFYLGGHSAVRNCTASENGSAGIIISNNCVVADCLVSSNATGISGGSDCIMSGSQANGNLDDGIDLGNNFDISGCTANGNSGNGFDLGNSGLVNNCTANTNGNFDSENNGYGILVGNNCAVNGCTASGNICGDGSGAFGIWTGGNCAVNYCTASGNGGVNPTDGIYAAGITVSGNNCAVNNCIASDTFDGDGIDVLGNNCGVNNCTASGNASNVGAASGTGIYVQGNNCNVNNCTASGNVGGIDIYDAENCTVNNCTASGNGGIGIYISGGLNRIDNNNVGGNVEYGIYPSNANQTNSITRNSALGSVYGNYSGNHDYAPIQTPSTATSPWANF